jgi:SAM-dependent methyltransferase
MSIPLDNLLHLCYNGATTMETEMNIIKWMHSVCGCTDSTNYSTYNQDELFPDDANKEWAKLQQLKMPGRMRLLDSHMNENLFIENVLDVGAGTGLFSDFAKSHFKNVECVEPCLENATKLTERGFKVHRDMLFVNKQYDVVHCNGVIEHVPNPYYFAVQLFRHTRPGGVCWIFTCNELGLLILCTIFRLLTLKRFSVRNYIGPWHINYWDREHVERLLISSGFRIVESWTEPWQQPPRRWSLRRFIHWSIRLHSICIVAKRIV